jgi:hypothetical protein
MIVEIKPELERRFQAIAQERSVSLAELVEEAMLSYLKTQQSDPSGWIKTTQGLLPNVWPPEDFTDWMPPDGR